MINLELFFVMAIVLLQSLLVLTGTTGVVRFISGFIFVSFLPGYTFLAAFYRPHIKKWDALEHSLLAVPVSLALSAILGIALNNFSLSIQPKSHLLWMSLFICFMAWLGRSSIKNTNSQPYLLIISGLLGAALLLAIFTDRALSKKPAEVSLYLLNSDGQAENYPRSITLGTPLRVIVGGYYNGSLEKNFKIVSSTGHQIRLRLQPGEEWRKEVQLTLQDDGLQSVSFRLYDLDTDKQLRLVQLWIEVE